MEKIYIMKTTFVKTIKSEIEIEFQKVFDFIKSELEKVPTYNKSVSKEQIYNAFRTNPFYYLVETEQIDKDMEVNDNKAMLNSIVDKFFIFCMKCETVSYYVLKGGEVLANYNDKEMASLYAHRMDGYIIEVK